MILAIKGYSFRSN